jgi:pimeloyl-ACP methyl ester carboxylesterase
MGGAVAQLVWQRHPQRVSGLVLAATAARFKVTRRHRWEFPALTGLSVVSRAAPAPAHRPILDTLITKRTRERDLHPWILSEIRKNNLREITEAGSQIGRFDSRDWVARIDVPTGVITVGDDTLVPTPGQLALAERLRHARHWHLGGGHDMCVTRPHEFVPTLVEAVKHATGQ